MFSELKDLKRRPLDPSAAKTKHSVYFDKVGRIDDTPVFLLDELTVGDEIKGPAMIIDDTQTIVLIPSATAVVCPRHLYISLELQKD